MMKCEFETLIGKEVSYETFEMYESMYHALPENISKVDFVNMLNIKAIPESEEAIHRRMEKEQLIRDIKQQIADLKEKIGYEQECIDRYTSYLNDTPYYEKKNFVRECKSWIAGSKRIIAQHKAEIRQLKQIIAGGKS